MIIRSAVFVKSASKLDECPQIILPEFAMIGRSNVGKSSLINTLVNKKKLSKISVTPGKTKLIGYFLVNDSWYLVDLPGYGYAKTGAENRTNWIRTTYDYFIGRESLKKVFVLVDGSIPMQNIDLDFIYSLQQKRIPFDIVITKIDKSSQKTLHMHTKVLKEKLSTILSRMPKIFSISNVSKKGKEELLDYIQTMI